ncbi:MAG: insulinase family protein, partial [Proteobacteria bacterium]
TQVQKAAEAYLIESNRSLGRFIPTQDPVRADSIKRFSQDEIDAMVKDYEGREAVAMGEDFDPSFDNIDARTEKRQLEQGTPVVLLPKKTRGESVVMRVRLDIGHLDALRDQKVVGQLTAGLLMRGTENYSRQALKTAFDELKATVSVYGGATGTTARVTTTKENLPKVIELLEEVFRKPVFDEEELQILKREQIVSLEQQKQQPNSQVFRTLGRHVFPYEPSHPKYQMPIDDEIAAIEAVTSDELKAFHAENYGAQAGEIVVVGDFDEATVMAALNDVFGNWHSKNSYERIESQYVEVESINQFIDTPDKAGAAFGVMMALPMSDEHEDYAAMLMANQMFGGGFISSRLANRLRQQDGLSYGAGSSFNAGSFDPVATFVAYAICAPENLPKVEQGFNEELQKVLDEGFTAEELVDAKKAVLQNNVLDRAKDARLAGTLQSNIDLERSMQWQKNLEQKIVDLTVAEVNAAFKKHIVPEKLSIVKAGDTSKIE